MKALKASLWTSAFALGSLIILGLLAFTSVAAEGGPAAQGALVIMIGAIPALAFSACFFPLLAKLTERNFTKQKWFALNFGLVILSGLTIEKTIGPRLGSEGGLFVVATPILATGVFILAPIWLKIAFLNTIEPNKSVDSTPVSAPR